MTTKLLLIAMLVIPYLAREVAHWAAKRGQPEGFRVGGVVSVCIWIPSHLILLALAIRSVITTPITFRGWVGYLIYCLAILLRIAAFQALRAFYSPDVVIREGHKVIEDGPYKYIRHPLHTALIFEMLGLLIMSGSWYAALLVMLSLLAHVIRSRREEDLLEHYLGESYRSYRNKTWDALDLFPGRKR